MWRIKALKRYVPLQARKWICILMPTSHLLTPSTHCVLLHHVIFWLLYSTAHVMLTPSYQRTAVSRSSLSVPECPFLPPTCKWGWFVPIDFKEPWRISLKEVTSSIHQNCNLSPSHILETDSARAPSEYHLNQAQHEQSEALLLTSAFKRSPVISIPYHRIIIERPELNRTWSSYNPPAMSRVNNYLTRLPRATDWKL